MLYLVSTPIGNLGDITFRAVEVLEKVQYLLCEDTRVTGGLLSKLKIKNKPKLISYYKEIESQKISEIIDILQKDNQVALVSDAGTPLLSDPGWLLVKTCLNMGLEVDSVPGANAILPALQLSGLFSGEFIFLGFLSKKKTEVQKILKSYPGLTKVAYEAPNRLLDTIQNFENETKIAVVVELTKLYQKVFRGRKDELLKQLSVWDGRGEVVLVWV